MKWNTFESLMDGLIFIIIVAATVASVALAVICSVFAYSLIDKLLGG